MAFYPDHYTLWMERVSGTGHRVIAFGYGVTVRSTVAYTNSAPDGAALAKRRFAALEYRHSSVQEPLATAVTSPLLFTVATNI
jgi:hypothetical protein